MVIIPERKMIFVHIPKTGGTAMRYALEGAFSEAWILPAQKGIGHRRLKRNLENLPSDYDSFTILRHPYEIYRSWFAWVTGNDDWHNWDDKGKEFALECRKHSIDWAVGHLCKGNALEEGEGFLKTYCLPTTKVLYYDNACEGAEHLLDVSLDMKPTNVSKGDKPELSEQSKQMIVERCLDDMKKMCEMLDVEIGHGIWT